MADPRHQKLANILIHYSLGIKPGDTLLIQAGLLARPLLRETYREALHAGAYVTVRMTLEDLQEMHLGEGSEDQLCYLSPIDLDELNHFDTRLVLIAQENTKALSGIDPRRLARAQQGRKPFLDRFMQRSSTGELRWCATLYPTHANAQDAGMSLGDYEDFVYSAGLLHEADPAAAWRKVHVGQQHIADYLMAHDEIHIVAPGTDLTYQVGGRTWINASGAKNFPDGEVFTSPIETSATGTVHFSYPAVYAGNEVDDVRLTFQDGKVVAATAGRGVDFLYAMIDQDEGARFLGEVAFGLNYAVKQFTRNPIFDEKLGGTMHVALGDSYPETGGTNTSGLHWDLVCDLRRGQVFADGQQCYADGTFTI